MKFYSNDGALVEEPFRKFESSHSLGRNHFYTVWLPILPGVPLVETKDGLKPADGSFKVVKSAKSGRYLIVPATPDVEPKTFLAFIGAESGFRGDAGLVRSDTTAQVLEYGSTQVALSGCMSVVALIRPGQRVVAYSNGRRGDNRIVWENRDGEIVHTLYTAEEYRTMIVPDGIAPEDWQEVA